VLGDTELHWFGASYGTYIGAVYAELFPRRVGRLVLDGALDPTLDATELPRQQAAGFETALRAYVADCVTKQGCPLGVDTEAGLQRIRQLLADLDAEPLPTDDPARPLTQELGVSAVIYPLYVPHLWSGLTVAIGAALNGNGRLLLNLVDLSSSRIEGEPPDDSWQARTGVNCSDRPAGLTVAGVKASLQSFRRASPTFGRTLAWSQLACVAWPVRPSPPPRIDGDGAAPILVVGTSRDPATPLRWAVALAGQLESGVLLTRDGDGHTAYGMGNACVDRVIDRYLVGGRVPQDGTAC
jgi:pimeloyl-ACP methyl ester carboxylesterase